MSKGNWKIKLLVLTMGLTLLGLVAVQAVWFSRAFDVRETQLSEKINVALRSVADQILKTKGDLSSRVEPIQQEASNAYFAKVGCNFPIVLLDSLLKKEFKARHIDLDYQYTMVESGSGEISLGNFVPLLDTTSSVMCKGRESEDIPYDFRVTFTNVSGSVLSSMGIWVFSSIAMIAVLAIFSLLLFFLIREKRLSQIKANFVNNLTHELKTPITNISIASEVLLNPFTQQSTERKQAYANIIHKESQRLKTLVDRVLQISVLENGKLHLEKAPIDLHKIISEAAEVAQARIEARQGILQLDLTAESPLIHADRHHLLNTLYNLIDNADKYSPKAPHIKIRSWSDSAGTNVSISDQGMGISPDKQGLIFGKFYRISQQDDIQEQGGSGLGLSYVQMIAKAHGGTVKVQSELGKGSTFTLFFPHSNGKKP